MGILDKFLGFLKGSQKKTGCDNEACNCKVNKGASCGPIQTPKRGFKLEIYSPCDGELVAQKDIPDEGFSEGHMGNGLGIRPSTPKVSVFMSGKLVVLFRTKHAYIIKDEATGVSVMLHLGINTVNIPEEKEAFKTNRQADEMLVAKEDLCEMNLQVIEQEATSIVSALLVQHDEMEGKRIIYNKRIGSVRRGDLLLTIVPA